MTVVALIVTPVVLLYQGWTYHVFRAAGRRATSRSRRALRSGRRSAGVVRALDPRLAAPRAAGRVLLAADAALGRRGGACSSSSRRRCSRASSRARSTARRSRAGRGAARRCCLVVRRRARVLAWGFEVAGRRAAVGGPLRLRLELVEHRLRQSGRARRRRERGGRDGRGRRASTRSRRLRALPAAGRAGGARAGRGARAGWRRSTSPRRCVMLLTLPLVPVFMWLIGRYTEERTRERWHALPAPLDALPRRRPRPADAARVQPEPRRRPRRSRR